MSTGITPSRTVYAPLQKLDKCCQCDAKFGLRLCSSCGERIYCSTECQKTDWKDHKQSCKQTERINLELFWPFFAYMAELSRVDPGRPVHPAILHKIVNRPIPNVSAQVLPDGSSTNVVLLGDPIHPDQTGSPEWWPTAISERMRQKLFRRILREGHALPITLSICVALLAEMYTTTYDPEKEPNVGDPSTGMEFDQFSHNKRFRLQCERNTITDFGICKGSAEVKAMDTFGYFVESEHSKSNVEFFRGQDPKDHYWIYFKTLREEFVMDLCMFTFNFAMCVAHGEPYCPSGGEYPTFSDLAGFFIGRELRQNTPLLQYEQQRFSVLHNKALQGIVRTPHFNELGERILVAFMERVAGRKTNEVEQDLLIAWTMSNRRMMAQNLDQKAFLNYPSFVPTGILYDPGEETSPHEDDEETLKYWKKLGRMERKGVISPNQLIGALRKWDALPAEERMAWRKGHKKI
ncbi:hypothetical protein P691DRAFT_703728 [Macrolepiota fuliginosa MF-IS2]|uniref:MYND-type domain-containing protein n=1 Tax=Macrolepiota fuliginosa MF-IS2 TaxID=1400762 RepID=A0A9P5XDP1_9AGAR|nr:hypothetical protein P691DRAFT_703728 [Macrolepiota fuliginosa MF-IS2]